jgi:hypothetical protein
MKKDKKSDWEKRWEEWREGSPEWAMAADEQLATFTKPFQRYFSDKAIDPHRDHIENLYLDAEDREKSKPLNLDGLDSIEKRIYDAAVAIAEEGHKTTFTEIEKRSGVSRQTVSAKMRGVSEKLGRHVKTDGAPFIWREPKPERGKGVERRDRRATLGFNIFEISEKFQIPRVMMYRFFLDFAWADPKKARKNRELSGFTDEWINQAAGMFAFFSASYPRDDNAESVETEYIDPNHWIEKTITDDEKAQMDEEIKRRDPALYDFIQKLGEDDGKIQIHRERKRKILPLKDYLAPYMFLFVCVLLDRLEICKPYIVIGRGKKIIDKQEIFRFFDLADKESLRRKDPMVGFHTVTWIADYLARKPIFFERYFNEIKKGGKWKASASFRTFFRTRIWLEMEKLASQEVPLSSDDEDSDPELPPYSDDP